MHYTQMRCNSFTHTQTMRFLRDILTELINQLDSVSDVTTARDSNCILQHNCVDNSYSVRK